LLLTDFSFFWKYRKCGVLLQLLMLLSLALATEQTGASGRAHIIGQSAFWDGLLFEGWIGGVHFEADMVSLDLHGFFRIWCCARVLRAQASEAPLNAGEAWIFCR